MKKKSDLLRKLEYNLAKNSVGAAVNMSIYVKYEHGAIGGVIDALLSSALSPILDKVDTLTAAADFSKGNQELMRILLAGGVRGAITGRDSMDGILSGIAEEYVAAKCKTVVAEWEREDKIREIAEAIERDGFAEDVNVKNRFAGKDESSSSSSAGNKTDKKQQEATKSKQTTANKSKGSKELLKTPLFEPLSKLKHQETIDKYGLITGANKEQNANKSLFEKLFNVVLPAAHADELGGEATSSNSNNKSKSWTQQYGEFLIDDYQDEIDKSQATLGAATGIVTGAAKIVTETGKLVYRLERNYINQRLLNDHAYAKAFSDEERNQMRQGINQDREGIKTFLTNPSVVGKAILTGFENQFTQVNQQLDRGDYFSAGKESGELAVDIATTASAGYGLAKTGISVASKLSIRGLDLAFNGMVSLSRALPAVEHGVITFQYQAAKSVACATQEIQQATKVPKAIVKATIADAASSSSSSSMANLTKEVIAEPKPKTRRVSELQPSNKDLNKPESLLPEELAKIEKKSTNTRAYILNDHAGHIFGNRDGHIPDTLENRKLLIDIANDSSTKQGVDKYGNTWYSQIRDDGSQAWVQVRNNKIRNGGINNPPRIWNNQTGYSSIDKPTPTKGPKNT